MGPHAPWELGLLLCREPKLLLGSACGCTWLLCEASPHGRQLLVSLLPSMLLQGRWG